MATAERMMNDMLLRARNGVANAEIELQRVKDINDRTATQRWKRHGNKGVTLEKQNRDIKRLGRAERHLIEARQNLANVENSIKLVFEKMADDQARAMRGELPEVGEPVLSKIPVGLLTT